MSSVVIAGNTSGTITLDAPNIAGSTVLTLPATSGTVLTSATGQTLTSPAIAGTPTGVGVLTSGTTVATTSGTSIGFTNVPSWVKRITLIFNGVSLSGPTPILVRLGTGATPTYATTGYVSSSSNSYTTGSGSASGFAVNNSASETMIGHMVITLLNGNIWVSSHALSTGLGDKSVFGGGNVTLGSALTAVAIVTSNGFDTFDAGSINIMYE
jgi:hypothetical protein